MTHDEQIRLVNGQSFFGTGGLESENIPRLQFLDGGTGLNFEQLFGDLLSADGKDGIGSPALRDVLAHYYHPEELSVDGAKELHAWIIAKLKERIPDLTPPGCYPPGMLLGATWNPETVEEVGHALGEEARAYGVHVLLGTPNVNIHRDPRNGRCFEGYSEDPFLVTQLAPALVRGVEAEGVAANVKHFAANNQETNRLGINEMIPERALHEIYYPGFQACVEAGCATVMAAYNAINGVPCTENSALLTDMLRGEWGFDGLTMSDWGAVYHPAAALNAGTDLNMPGPVAPDALKAALADGSLDKEKLAQSAERMRTLAQKYGKAPTGTIDLARTDKAAYDAAAEGIVMLKNDGGCCPLPQNAKIALFGEHCDMLLTCGEGSAHVNTTRNASFVTELRRHFPAVQRGAFDGADTMIYVLSTRGMEGNDRKTLELSDEELNAVSRFADYADKRNLRKILVLNISAPVQAGPLLEDFDAIFCIFLCGMQGAAALADILAGTVNPSGHLPLTFPLCDNVMPTAMNFPGDGMQVCYGEGIFVGYRWYTTMQMPARWNFGYGLSYTTFAITDLHTDSARFTDSVNVSVTVKNTGERGGKTVVQIYVSDPVSTLTKPIRELKAFRKVRLDAGEEKTLTFTLDRHAFESWDPDLHAWTLEEGEYRILAGFSETYSEAVSVYADVTSPYSYGENTSVKVIYENDTLRQMVKAFMDENNLPWTAVLSSYEYTAQDKIGIHLRNADPAKRDALYASMKKLQRL